MSGCWWMRSRSFGSAFRTSTCWQSATVPEHHHVASRVAEHDLRDCVTLVGSVSHADTPAYYRAGDVFALSSEFDNSPNAVLEAMACGLPIVATDSGGVREFVDDSSSGAIVPTGDARALADALERYLANPELARKAGDHNRRKASTEFSWPESARQLREVYRTTIESRRRTTATSA
jgi:glycosyltransferase involved in cell wall biosynthesis